MKKATTIKKLINNLLSKQSNLDLSSLKWPVHKSRDDVLDCKAGKITNRHNINKLSIDNVIMIF